MKRIFLLFSTLLLCLCVQGQFYSTSPIYTSPKLKEHGIIYLMDGTSREYDKVRIGVYDNKHVHGEVGDEKYKYALDEVDHVEFWDPEIPECPHYLLYYTTILNSFADWGYVAAGTDDMYLVKIGVLYSIDDDGSIKVTHQGIRSCFYKPSTRVSLYAFPDTKKHRQRIADLFSDDPLISDYILTCGKNYSVNYILENYNPE